jgi:hypothetical protein
MALAGISRWGQRFDDAGGHFKMGKGLKHLAGIFRYWQAFVGDCKHLHASSSILGLLQKLEGTRRHFIFFR